MVAGHVFQDIENLQAPPGRRGIRKIWQQKKYTHGWSWVSAGILETFRNRAKAPASLQPRGHDFREEAQPELHGHDGGHAGKQHQQHAVQCSLGQCDE